MEHEELSYCIALETPTERSALPAGCRDIPEAAATWGIFEARGPIPEAIQGMTPRIFSERFPSSGREHAERPEMEIYSAGDIRDADYAEIWVPLQKPTR